MVIENATEPLPPSSPTRHRQFGVYDLMIVIAGIATLLSFSQRPFLIFVDQCIGLIKTVAAYLGFMSSNGLKPSEYLKESMKILGSGIWAGLRVSEQLILIVTPVFLLIRFRNPRPPIRVLLKQPGTIAGLAAALGLTLVVGWLHRVFFGGLVDGMVNPIIAGGTVALAWICLALCKKRRKSVSVHLFPQKKIGVSSSFPPKKDELTLNFPRVNPADMPDFVPVRKVPTVPGHQEVAL